LTGKHREGWWKKRFWQPRCCKSAKIT